MKRFVISLLILASALSVKADCSWAGIWCWPTTPTLKANGILVIEFYGDSQAWAAGLGQTKKAYLKMSNEKIPLLVQDLCKGEFHLTQAILRPAHKLTPGMEYQIALDSNDSEVLITHYHEKRNVAVTWKAVEAADNLLLEWTGLPSYENKTYTLFGCGPAEWVNFKVGCAEPLDILVKATVTSLSSGKSSSYYLIPKDGRIQVGHGMCAGAFRFREGKKYEVTFSLMDATGNYSCEQTKPIRFTRPEPTDGEE